MLILRDAIAHLVSENVDFCGCGKVLAVTHDTKENSPYAQLELQILSRCHSCWAILCSTCGTESQYCDGCFNILQESSLDIDDDDGDIYV